MSPLYIFSVVYLKFPRYLQFLILLIQSLLLLDSFDLSTITSVQKNMSPVAWYLLLFPVVSHNHKCQTSFIQRISEILEKL
jgi:hypothetical protein